MRSSIIYLGLIIISSILFSCKKGQNKNEFLILNGTISNGVGEKLLFQLLTPERIITLDSIKLKDDGKFTFNYSPIEKSIFLLRNNENKIITIIGDKSETLNIIVDYSQFDKSYKIEGNQESIWLMLINEEVKAKTKILDSLGKLWKNSMYESNSQNIKTQLDSIYYKAFREQKAFQQKFIEQNSGTFAAMLCLYIPFGRESVFKDKKDYSLFIKVRDSLAIKYPENTQVKKFADKIRQKEMQLLENELSLKRN